VVIPERAIDVVVKVNKPKVVVAAVVKVVVEDVIIQED
jgi:hypothetical protein